MATLDPLSVYRGLTSRGVPPADAATGLLIAQRESSLDPTQVNLRSQATGLFQFLPSTWRDLGCSGDPKNANSALDCFAVAYRQSGFSHWGGPDVLHPVFNGHPITDFAGNEGATPGAIQKSISGLCHAPVIGGIIQGFPGGAAACSGVGQAVQGAIANPVAAVSGAAGDALGSAASGAVSDVQSLFKQYAPRGAALVIGGALILIGVVAVVHITPPQTVPVPVPA